jgi:hypothetical protein
MGLDMYLTKKTSVKFGAKVKSIEFISDNGEVVTMNINPERIEYIVEEIGYWRKANAVHRWFVDNVQEGEDDCKGYYVSREQLTELLSVCKKIKENPTEDNCRELLPTEHGFFFGSTVYGDGYMNNIDETITIIESALSEPKGGSFYYQSSW